MEAVKKPTEEQVVIHRQYGPYSAELVFAKEDHPETLEVIQELILRAYVERIQNKGARVGANKT